MKNILSLNKEPSGVRLKEKMLTPCVFKNNDLTYNCHGNQAVLLKVKSVALCRTDLLVAEGKIAAGRSDLTLGHEFSATVEEDLTGYFKKGDWVGVNPLWWGSDFMGLDIDGALCEYVWVPERYVIPTVLHDAKIIAYLEPVAASMAVLKALPNIVSAVKNQDTEEGFVSQVISPKIAVIGDNRIAKLTHIIIESLGYTSDLLDENSDFGESCYDYVIETVLDDAILSKISRALGPAGTLVIKSRKKIPVSILMDEWLKKELKISCVNYHDFHQTMRWLEKHSVLIEGLLGEQYPLAQWRDAFEAAKRSEGKKIFIQVS